MWILRNVTYRKILRRIYRPVNTYNHFTTIFDVMPSFIMT